MYVVLTTGPGYNTHGVEKIAKCAKKNYYKNCEKICAKIMKLIVERIVQKLF